MERVVHMGEMQFSRTPEEVLVTRALGSCLGIILRDPEIPVAGMIHTMLPYSRAHEEQANAKPWLFVDKALPRLFKTLTEAEAKPSRIQVFAAGGSNFSKNGNDIYAIGVRNFVSLCEQLRNLQLALTRYDVGGKITRTLCLQVGSGQIWIESLGRRWEL